MEDASGQKIGAIRAENWRAWNFSIQDPAGTEVGRITKTWEGLAKTVFTTADNYVLEVNAPVSPTLRSVMLASGAGIDLALKQDSRGLSQGEATARFGRLPHRARYEVRPLYANPVVDVPPDE